MTVDDVQTDAGAQPRCFFDVEIGGLSAGRIIFELFYNVTPKTAENFRALCAGDQGIGKTTEKPLHYKSTVFHRVIKGFMIQGGDFSNGNGTGGESIYGGTFEDENFDMKHDEPYLLSMANRGPATNGSQFFILTQPAPHLNGVHVVFGRVISGQAIVKQIEGLPVDRKSRPLQDVRITNSGELVLLKRKKEKKPKKVKPQPKEDASSGEITDSSSDADGEISKRKKETEADEDENREVQHPLVVVREIKEEDIPPDPSNRFLMRGLPEKEDKTDNKGKADKSIDKKRERRSRSRSRDRGRDRDRGRRNDRNRDNDRGNNRFNDGRRFGSYQVSSATGKKIKGRGKICYRAASSSRSRSKTPPHWKAEARKTITMKEFEEKEKVRRVREEELRRRREERQKRHEENEREKEESRKLISNQTGNPDDGKDTNIQDEITSALNISSFLESSSHEISGDGVVYYQHLFKKTTRDRKESHTDPSDRLDLDAGNPFPDDSLTACNEEGVGSIADEALDFLNQAAELRSSSSKPVSIFKDIVNPEDEEEERRLRNELLKKRFKAWEESSGEEGERNTPSPQFTETHKRIPSSKNSSHGQDESRESSPDAEKVTGLVNKVDTPERSMWKDGFTEVTEFNQTSYSAMTGNLVTSAVTHASIEIEKISRQDNAKDDVKSTNSSKDRSQRKKSRDRSAENRRGSTSSTSRKIPPRDKAKDDAKWTNSSKDGSPKRRKSRDRSTENRRGGQNTSSTSRKIPPQDNAKNEGKSTNSSKDSSKRKKSRDRSTENRREGRNTSSTSRKTPPQDKAKDDAKSPNSSKDSSPKRKRSRDRSVENRRGGQNTSSTSRRDSSRDRDRGKDRWGRSDRRRVRSRSRSNERRGGRDRRSKSRSRSKRRDRGRIGRGRRSSSKSDSSSSSRSRSKSGNRRRR